ncbi:c6 zinc finger domain containing protein [Grosmannia clavigera kw1407]|uniref:C6 zinc finger domain containing protein n=1 Tax=Grosmannia clavigera (strain kw1407 / UAMH 11150) TaxID=655863 RepID=F0X9B0_GROCL|nr:c6 zinc finger domain containing protein [Grosmannia clavigera kw1407]EFX05651.1 c6 zinc finger domain containing protein [Grosmannia clavigera kw1407]
MQNRIDRLEGLVLSLMHSGADVDPITAASAAGMVPGAGVGLPPRADSLVSTRESANQAADDADDSDIDDGLATSLGVLKVDTDRGKSMYVGQEHWHTLLADITEVKNYFTMHKKELESSYEKVLESKPATSREAPTFLHGAPPTTEADLRAELPPKSTVLTLCGRYFNSMDNAVNIIHAPTFNAQLRSHWQDPSKTPIMWLGLLYSILCLAMLSYHKVGDEPPEWKGRAMELAALFRVRTVQCLVVADYTKPVEYTVETMILYVFGEYSSRWDADLGLWLIGSLITRVAFRMGYHRDAKWFPSITPFQAEMRRRTWALLPLNIFDEEFDPSTKKLPPPRPSSEPTPISYMIAKVKLCQELGNILQATTRVGKPVSYDEIIRLDSRLRAVKNELPPHLKLHPLERSRDPLTLIIARFNIDILYQKIMCLLHRKYLPRSRQNARYDRSRRAAIEASLETLHHLRTLAKESEPSGRLRSIKWYVSSIATKDFLLPAMLVALEVRFNNTAEKSGETIDPQVANFWTPAQRIEMRSVLETTKEIWRPLADGSMEAFKAYNILRVVLEQMGSTETPPTNPSEVVPMCKDVPALGANPTPPDSCLETPGNTQLPPPLESDMMAPLGLAPTAGPNLNGLFGTSMQSPEGVAYGTMDATMGNELGGTDLAPPEFQGDYLSSMATFNFAAPGLAYPGTLVDESMDLTSNFDWDTLQNYAQSGAFAGDPSFQFFPGSSEVPVPGVKVRQ